MNPACAEPTRLSPVLRETARALGRSSLVSDYCASFERLARIHLDLVPEEGAGGMMVNEATADGPALVARVPVRMGSLTVAWLRLEPVRWTEPAWQPALGDHVVVGRSCAHPTLRLRRVDSRQYAAWLQLVAIFARQLGERANELAIRQAEARHPLVRRVKEFIVLHVGEEIMLRRAAAVAGFSPCYFCKLFHRVAGMGFSEYLARLRVEAAKAMLLDPHTRINEAAFRAGFQSLSQFNRAFRRITGESPSAHRARLGDVLGAAEPAGARERLNIAA